MVYIMQVLIVDDNQDITDLLSKFLKAKGFDNVVANDPRNGLERIKEEKYDVVLLDIFMPGFSGIDIQRVHMFAKNLFDRLGFRYISLRG